MSLHPLFGDYYCYEPRPRVNRRRRPFVRGFLDALENDMDQKVGYFVRSFPDVQPDLMENFANVLKGREGMPLENSLADGAVVMTKDNRFHIRMDTSSFQPDDISVKIVGNRIEVKAKSEIKGEDVYELRETHRSFIIPEGVEEDQITSKLSSNGCLTIEAPWKGPAVTERAIAIEREKREQPASDKSEK